VTVIGVDIWESERSKVPQFVTKQGDKMGYTVAMEQIDEGAEQNDGKMSKAWMQAAGQNGIPCSFIVDRDGTIAWIGHPMFMDKALEMIVAGTFDRAAYAEVEKKREARQLDVSNAMQAKEWDKAMSIVDGIIAEEPWLAGVFQAQKLSILSQKGDAAAVNAMAKELVASGKKDQQSSVVRILAMSPNAKQFDMDFVLSVAKDLAANAEADDWQSGLWLARVYAAREEYDKAASAMRDTVQKADPRIKQQLERMLKDYEEKAGEAKKVG
jgi:hypothetical protein